MKDSSSHRILARIGQLYRQWGRKRAKVSAATALRSVRRVVGSKRYCLLVTRSCDGVDARVVQPWRPDEELTVWLGTAPDSRKVEQLRSSGRASLVYQDDRHHACVVLVGEASLVNDREVCRRRFMPIWRAFFPDGPDAGFVAVRFATERIEVIDFARHVTPEPFGLRAAVLVRGDGGWRLD